MIDPKAVAYELDQARQARLEAELAGCEVEELAEELRRTPFGRPILPADGLFRLYSLSGAETPALAGA